MTFFLLFDVHIILNGYNASINYSLTLPLYWCTSIYLIQLVLKQFCQ
uniref:Uncharacterized protein n=1 Tax=Anguilla anguilla TaxID=7936 RepID=A0A0E9P8H7_ANGAN